MTGEITVRPQRPGDGARLARAWLDAGRYYAELAPDTFQVPRLEGLEEFMDRDGTISDEPDVLQLVAEVGGRVVGAAAARIEAPVEGAEYQLQRQFAETRLFVDAVIVEEAHRRSGVGQRLMAALEEWGRERGATVSLLDTYPESALSLPFFTERMGYGRRSVRLWKRL
ncbi:MAG TPA: GNAT family N-acetyltransferase [Candidatus Dormibacteraeota bacterium]|nr:GNAT family N-acetyltransferase [Candidatus Dormibacteraeota bacterium]